MAFNGIKYIKNVTKSFGYAIVDVAGEISPVTKAFAETNEELGKQLYSAVADYKNTFKKAKTSVIQSDVYEFAKNYKNNLLSDLKSGKFYNKDRIDEISEKISGWDDESLETEFSDMFDDEFDDIGWDKDDLRSDMFMASHIDDVGQKIADSNAEVTIRSAEYMVRAQKESTKALALHNSKLFGQALEGMAAINSNIGQLVGMPQLMQVHTNNASTFFEKTSGQLDTIIDALQEIQKNTTISAVADASDSDEYTFRDIVRSKGVPDLKRYMSHVKKNIKSQFSEFDMLGDMFGNGVSMLQSLAASPLEELMKTAVRQTIPTVLKSSAKQFNDTMQGFFSSIISMINRGDSDNEAANFIKKIFGIETDMKTTVDVSKFERGKVPWDGVARKALVEVIPGQLAKIVSALTGEEPRVFNPETGRMQSIGSINDYAESRLQYAADSAGYKVRSEFDRLMRDKQKFKSKSDERAWQDALDMFFRSAFEQGGLSYKDLNKHSIQEMLGYGTNSGMNADLILDLIYMMSKNKKKKGDLLDFNRRILSGRDNLTAQMKEIETRGSADNYLYNGMFDSFLDFYNEDNSKSIRSATGIRGVKNSLGGTLATQFDDRGNNIFFYLQEIFRRQDAMYQNTNYMVSNWGGGYGGGKRRRGGNGSYAGTPLPNMSIYENEYTLGKTAQAQYEAQLAREDKYYDEELKRALKENPDLSITGSDKGNNKLIFNAEAADYWDEYEKRKDNMTFADKMLAQKSVSGKLGVLANGARSMVSTPLMGIAKMFDSASDSMYNLIYGEKPSDELKDMGFIGLMAENIKGVFSKANDWLDDNIFAPLKAKMGLNEKGDLGRKIFGIFGQDYDAFQDKMKQGVFGTKDDNGIRSGGLLGDYLQDVKDNGKAAFNWSKNGLKEVKDSIFGSGTGMFDRYKSRRIDKFSDGGTVKKTGIAAVSEGELIIPSELNPFYHGKTDKNAQIAGENKAVAKFFGKFSGGSTGVSQQADEEIEQAISESNIADAAMKIHVNPTELIETIKKMLYKSPDTSDTSEKRISKYKRTIKGYLASKISTHAKMVKANRMMGKGSTITEYDNDKGIFYTDDNAFHKMGRGRYVKSGKNGNELWEASHNSFGKDVITSIAQGTKSVYDAFVKDNRKGPDDTSSEVFHDMIDDVTGNFGSYAGAMTVGGGIGAAASLLTGLVGGPLVGAAVGSAVGLTMKSDKVQRWLFGDVDEETGENKGGVFSREMTKLIKEKAPGMAKWGLAGGIAGTIMGHPLLGTLIGASVSYAGKSEAFSNLMFNGTDEEGRKHKGLLNKTQEEFNKDMQKKLPRMGAGSLVGLLAGPFPSVTANLILGSAIGFASDTEKFKSMIFGHEDENGERQGGLLGHIKQGVITPFAEFMKDQATGVKDWLQKDIMQPVTDSIEPITKQLGLIGKALLKPGKWLFGKLAEKADFGALFERKPFRVAKSIASNAANAGIGLAKWSVGLPFQLLGAAGSNLRSHQINKGNADYMTAQERINFRNGHQGEGNFEGRLRDVGDAYSTGWSQLGTRGKRLSGIGNILRGVGKTAQLVPGGITDITNGSYAKFKNSANGYDKADEFMANASVDQLKDLRSNLINVVDAKAGFKTNKQNAKKDINRIVRANLFGKVDQSVIDKFIKKAQDPNTDEKVLRNILEKAKGVGKKGNANLSKDQINNILSLISGPRKILADLSQYKNGKEYADATQADARAALESDTDNWGWIQKILKDKSGKNGKKLLDMLDYEIDMSDDVQHQKSDEELVQEKEEERHNEVLDGINRVATAMEVNANMNAIANGQDMPYPDSMPVKAASAAAAVVADATGIKRGDYKNGEIVWGNNGDRWKYDAESGELEPDNDEAKRVYEERHSNKKEPDANEIIKTSEEKNEEDDEKNDAGILSDLLSMFGVDGGVATVIAKIKNKMWLPSLVGPLLLSGFLTGKLDSPISGIAKWVAKKLGFDETTTNNMGASGEDGEQSYSGNFWSRVLKNTITGVNPDLTSKILGFTARSLKKGGDKALKKGGLVRTPLGMLSKVIGKGFEGAEGLSKRGETALSNLRGKFVSESVEAGAEAVKDKKSWGQIIASKLGKQATEEGVEEAAEAVVKEAGEEAGKIKPSTLKAIKDKLIGFFMHLKGKGKLPANVSDKVINETADMITDAAQASAKTASKTAGKKTFVGTLKSMGPVGWAATLVFAVKDFADGYDKASSILGIKEPSTASRVVAGLVNSTKGLIEGLIAAIPGIGTVASIALSLIPTKTFITIYCNTIGKALNPNLLKEREAYQNEINDYNEKHGTSYDTEQYNVKVNNTDKGWFKNTLESLQRTYSKKAREKFDSGDSDVAGYINKNTSRWKYYSSQIHKGMPEDYATALYLNECLHDSYLELTDERRTEYETIIAEYKASSGAKPIPKITNDLYKLISTGRVQKHLGAAANFANNIFSHTGLGKAYNFGKKIFGSNTVDYGDGVTSDSFVGSYATGGVIPRSGYAALSKGEYRLNLLSMLGGFGKFDKKDLEDLTDMSSFYKDINNLSDKDSMADFWDKVDSKVSSTGLLGAIKKALYRVTGAMLMPSFALTKIMNSVSDNLNPVVGAAKNTRSTTAGSNQASAQPKKQGFISKAFSNISGFLGKLFGSGSGLYGGASGMSSDGTFISQMDSSAAYGDSTYAEQGCAPATAAMLINAVNGPNMMTMERAGKYALNKGYKVNGDGTREQFFDDIFRANGVSSDHITNAKSAYENIKAGRPTIILGQNKSNGSKRNSPFGKNPHYVLATGVDANGNIVVNDPEAKRPGKVYKRDILSSMKSAISAKLGGGSGFFRYGGAGDVQQIKEQVWAFLTSKGVSEAAAAGIMGNFQAESNFNTGCVEAGNNHAGHGIAQWSYGRWTNLEKYARANNRSWEDLDLQLSFLWKELTSGNWVKTYRGNDRKYNCPKDYSGVDSFEKYIALNDPIDAARIFMYRFERPNYSPSINHIDRREKAAADIYSQFTGKSYTYTGTTFSSGEAGSEEESSPMSAFGKAFNSIMETMYGSRLMKAVTDAGIYSGGDESTTAETAGAVGTPTTATVTTANGASISQSSTIGNEVASDAANYIGGKYVWGGNDLSSGVDCSGFTQQLFKKHGFNIPQRNSKAMYNDSSAGTTISGGSWRDLLPGDVMFFSNNGSSSGIHHVGIYAGNGQLIHAQSTKTGIVKTDLANSDYYQTQYIGAKRYGSYGSGSGISTNEVLSNTFKSSDRPVNVVKQQRRNAELSSGATRLLKGLTSTTKSVDGSTVGLTDLIEAINKLADIMKLVVDNTSPIAKIFSLMSDSMEAKSSNKTTKPSMVKSSKEDPYESQNSQDMLALLTSLAQA